MGNYNKENLLNNLKVNQKGKVRSIKTNDQGKLEKLLAMGVLPGLTVTLLQKFPSYIFKIGQSQFAIDRTLAENILVEEII